MSVKKEVEKLSQVYSSILNEEMTPGDAQSVNIANPTSINVAEPPALDAPTGLNKGMKIF